mgnify:CR=1 FL=1
MKILTPLAILGMALSMLACQPSEINEESLFFHKDLNNEIRIKTDSSFSLLNDGIADLEISIDVRPYPSDTVYTYNIIGISGTVAVQEFDYFSGDTKFEYGTPVMAGWFLNEDEYCTIYYSGSVYTAWGGTNTDSYIGVKIMRGDHPYYGWLKTDIDKFTKEFIITDWAIFLGSNQSINCGQTDS